MSINIGKIFKLPLVGRHAISLNIASDRHGSATRAAMVTGKHAFETNLHAKVIRGADYELTDGRIVSAYDLSKYTEAELDGKQMVPGTGRELAIREYFGTRKEGDGLFARLYNGTQKLWYTLLYQNKTSLDLGSGLITNVSQLALANDWNLASPSAAAINLIKLSNYHATGTGATAAAATDIKLQTSDGVASVAGAQSLVSAANLQKYQTIATIAYAGTEAVTEWGLHTNGTLSAATGTPVTAGSATSATVTGTPLTASSTTVQGQQQTILHDTGNATPMWGYVTSNTTSVVTVPAWYKVADGTAAGTTPANTDALVFRPIMLDHKVFAAINVVSGDSIQFTYLLTCATGG